MILHQTFILFQSKESETGWILIAAGFLECMINNDSESFCLDDWINYKFNKTFGWFSQVARLTEDKDVFLIQDRFKWARIYFLCYRKIKIKDYKNFLPDHKMI